MSHLRTVVSRLLQQILTSSIDQDCKGWPGHMTFPAQNAPEYLLTSVNSLQ